MVKATPILSALLLMLPANDSEAQVVRASATPLMPHTWIDAATKSSGDRDRDRDRERNRISPAEAAHSFKLYGAAYLGMPGGMIAESGLEDSGKNVFHYPAIHFVFSAAARLQPHGDETRTGRALKRFNAHVQIEALNRDTQLIAERGALEVLDVQPNTQAYVQNARDTTTVHGAAVTTLSRQAVTEVFKATTSIARVGPLVASFAKIFHHPSAPTQVSYVSDRNEFGWVWYEHSDTTTLEGLHRAAVLLETHPDVRFLQVRIQIITDWGSRGVWRREFESLIDLGPGG
jgi:hypothetical protein